ncbi:MAG: cysteine dioxygenase family protein [Bacteroidales bacterium]|nr:cysteine dioxygenase family protein [Bacteroidales bacterium]
MRSEHRTLPGTLQYLIQEIEDCNEVDSSKLIDFIHSAKLQKEEFEPFSDFSHQQGFSYARTRLYEGASFNIYLMSWAPGDFTAIHSHGQTDWGAVLFFSDVNHRLYKVQEKNIQLIDKTGVKAGTIAPVNGNLVHAMGNLSENPAMSLHIYGSEKGISNANDGSLVYELEKMQIRRTHGEAYINIAEENCLETLKGLTTNKETLVDYLNIVLPYYKKNGFSEMCNKIVSILSDPESHFLH